MSFVHYYFNVKALTGGGTDHFSNILAYRGFGWLLLIFNFQFKSVSHIHSHSLFNTLP